MPKKPWTIDMIRNVDSDSLSYVKDNIVVLCQKFRFGPSMTYPEQFFATAVYCSYDVDKFVRMSLGFGFPKLADCIREASESPSKKYLSEEFWKEGSNDELDVKYIEKLMPYWTQMEQKMPAIAVYLGYFQTNLNDFMNEYLKGRCSVSKLMDVLCQVGLDNVARVLF